MQGTYWLEASAPGHNQASKEIFVTGSISHELFLPRKAVEIKFTVYAFCMCMVLPNSVSYAWLGKGVRRVPATYEENTSIVVDVVYQTQVVTHFWGLGLIKASNHLAVLL